MDVFTSVKDTIQKESTAVLEVLECMDQAALERAVQVISECRGKLILSGCGTSASTVTGFSAW